MNENYQCCFCGQTIEPSFPDVGGLLYTAAVDQTSDRQHDQQLFCHTACLEARLHPSVKMYVLNTFDLERQWVKFTA